MAETIGIQLKLAREAKNLSIQKVVQATHIRGHHIEAIEADDFESLPSPIQARAFLRLYTEFLGLSLEEVIANQRNGVAELSATPAGFPPPGQNRDSAPDIGNSQVQAKTRKLINVLSTVSYHFNRVFHRQKVQPVGIESAEVFAAEEPVEEENLEKVISQEESTGSTVEILPSQAIFNSIGKTLKQRRESLSLTLDEIERHTHVRKHYLDALEAGKFAGLPSSVQARGMLNNYAHFLNLDVDTILLVFADGLQTQLLERQARALEESDKASSKSWFAKNRPFKIEIPGIVRRYISMDVIVGGGLVILLVTFAIWGTNRIINMRNESTPQPTAPPMLNFLLLTPEPASATSGPETTGNVTTSVAGPVVETLAVILPGAGQGLVQVVVIAETSAYVRVTVDGKVQFDGRVIAGTAYSYDGNVQIEVLTGNARAISILYNQNNLGPMGDVGQVVDRIYTANAILNPTATFTPTPSITPTPTVTLRPTATLRPSSTPRVNPTPRPSQTPER
jgi:cytoskeletal protein RodZ